MHNITSLPESMGITRAMDGMRTCHSILPRRYRSSRHGSELSGPDSTNRSRRQVIDQVNMLSRMAITGANREMVLKLIRNNTEILIMNTIKIRKSRLCKQAKNNMDSSNNNQWRIHEGIKLSQRLSMEGAERLLRSRINTKSPRTKIQARATWVMKLILTREQ